MILCGVVFVATILLWIIGRKKLLESSRKMLMVLSAAAALGFLAGVTDEQGGALEELGLPRNAVGEGSYEEELQIDAGDVLEKYYYTVTVPEQVPAPEEEKHLLEQAIGEIDAEFLGENTSLSDIQKKVVIRESYQNGLVEASWNFDHSEIVDYEGEIIAEDLPQTGVLVQAAVELTCGESGKCYEFSFCVMPLVRSRQEQLIKDIEDNLAEQGEQSGIDKVILPERLSGEKLQWSRKEEYLPEKILALGIVVMASIPLLGLSKRQEERKKREEQLLLEYPDVISKLVLLMGAGMTLFGAWKKIAEEYEIKRKNNALPMRISCEEMLYTCHEIEGGIGEGRAYERFGERCGEKRYRKLGNTLSQNLRKGNQGLVDLLETEVEEAFEERKSVAKKYGEEAGTKLLFPMIIMLAMIMALLLVPAMISMNI